MKQTDQNFIVINGRTYDARTGLQAKEGRSNAAHGPSTDITGQHKIPPHHSLATHKPMDVKSTIQNTPRRHTPSATAKKLHRTTQKAHTLVRTVVHRPQADIAPPPQVRSTHHRALPHQRLERVQQSQSPRVHRFTTPDIAPNTPPRAPEPPIADQKTSLSLAQLQQSHLPPQSPQAPTLPPHLSGSQLKEALIQTHMHKPLATRETKLEAHQQKVNSFFSRQPRLLTAMAGTLGVLLLIAYVTYLNMPGISLRIAASRAGFAAAMPGYTPSGYSLSGPVAYSPGQVNLSFGSNTNHTNFSLLQKQTNWDTQALLDNYVERQSDNYLTYQEKGLTIFMYDGKASWVNGGVWYNIDGSAKLSSEQILKIASSM